MTSGFGYIAFLMANIYGMVRLLPPNHAYLNPDNIRKFGIKHVIAEASNHLVIKKENIDQMLVFTAMIIATVLLFLQFVMVIYSLVIQPAAAGFFETVNPNTDVAFMLLDHVFGVPDMFNSCVSSGAFCAGVTQRGAFPFPFHIALQSLFSFYSMALLMVGVFIFLYFMIVVVLETASSGTPFGQRFANIWVPIRLVVALALLVPVSNGYNSGQYIALTAAKMGSGLATNGWITYNQGIAERTQTAGQSNNNSNPLGEQSYGLIAKPATPEISPLFAAMTIVHACAYNYLIEGTGDHTGNNPAWNKDILDPGFFIKPYFVKQGVFNNSPIQQLEITQDTTYRQALDFYGNGDIIIRFGEYNPNKFSNENGSVFPYCGDIKIKISDLSQINDTPNAVGGPIYMLMKYFDLVKFMWFRDRDFPHFAARTTEVAMSADPCAENTPSCTDGGTSGNLLTDCTQTITVSNTNNDGTSEVRACTRSVSNIWKKRQLGTYQGLYEYYIHEAWRLYADTGADLSMSDSVLRRGWGGAGIWFNRLAQLNGALTNSVLDSPELTKYPSVMEECRSKRKIEDEEFKAIDQFTCSTSTGAIEIDGDQGIAIRLNEVFIYINKDGIDSNNQAMDGNMFERSMNMLFGTSGLFDMRRTQNTHPLTQLIMVGKGLVDSAVRNMAASSILAFGGGMSGGGQLGKMAGAASQFFQSTAFMGLTAGWILFYVLPFLPFLYFYFAVASWLKTVFEAMVGTPLWALAHLRIDGEGLPGKSAENGYYLILEIFLRPILTVFGLIAALTIFGAQIRVLHFLWDQVISNVAGFDSSTAGSLNVQGGVGIQSFTVERSIVDQFFFTIIYTMIVYMLAMTSFKLIDRIPDNILRWMGSSASSFSDINQEKEVEGMARQVGTAGLTFGQTLSRGVTTAAGGLGRAIRGDQPPPTQQT